VVFYFLIVYIKCFISRTEGNDLFHLIFTGTIERLLVGNTTVDIKAKSHYLDLEIIANPNVFTGVVADLEGSMVGIVKPRLFGKCFNIKPIYVDGPNLILGISWKQDGTRDSLDHITEVDFSDATSLQAYNPISSHYVTCLSEGLIKLGSMPIYTITVDAEQSANTYEKFIALLVSETTIPRYYIDGSIPIYTLGHYITAKTSYSQLDAYFKMGLDIYSWFSATAELIISTLNRAGTPVITFVDDDKLPLKLNEIPIFLGRVIGRNKPPYNIDIEYEKNYHIQSGGDLTGETEMDADKRTRFETRVLLSSEQIPDPFDLFPIKEDIIISTAVQNKADADLLRSNWVDIRRNVMDLFSITVPILSSTSEHVLGIVPRFIPLGASSCVTFDSSHYTFDSTIFTFDRTDTDCHFAFGASSIHIGVNSREMSCTYELSGTRLI